MSTRRSLQTRTDEELEQLLQEESKRRRSISPQERAIAHRFIREIEWEKIRRYEARWGLK